MEYMKRIVDSQIENNLEYMGAIYLKGCKWCGKSTTAKQYTKSQIDFSDPDNHDRYMMILNEKPSLLLEGEKPRLLDEWQIAKKIWNSVKYYVDKTGEVGQFILSGSATPIEEKKDDIPLHPGTGRFAFITMKPMTLFESGESNGKISLKDIVDGKRDIDGIKSDMTYERLANIICRGGWPASVKLDIKNSVNISKNYIESVCKSDASRVDGVTRNPELVRAVLKAYARQICTIDSDENLYQDILSNYDNISKTTVNDYLDAIKKLLIIEEIPAWNPNIRSKTSIRTSPKKTFVDPSLATAALDISPKELMLDVNTFGLMFENLVNRDLSVYVESIGGSLNHFRDRFGLECDNVIRFHNGKYALVEVKLSANGIDQGEKSLLRLAELIKESNKDRKIKINEPDFLMIITGTNDIAYTTKNNVLVVPIGCLKN